jgi:hypothetical protein
MSDFAAKKRGLGKPRAREQIFPGLGEVTFRGFLVGFDFEEFSRRYFFAWIRIGRYPAFCEQASGVRIGDFGLG